MKDPIRLYSQQKFSLPFMISAVLHLGIIVLLIVVSPVSSYRLNASRSNTQPVIHAAVLDAGQIAAQIQTIQAREAQQQVEQQQKVRELQTQAEVAQHAKLAEEQRLAEIKTEQQKALLQQQLAERQAQAEQQRLAQLKVQQQQQAQALAQAQKQQLELQTKALALKQQQEAQAKELAIKKQQEAQAKELAIKKQQEAQAKELAIKKQQEAQAKELTVKKQQEALAKAQALKTQREAQEKALALKKQSELAAAQQKQAELTAQQEALQQQLMQQQIANEQQQLIVARQMQGIIDQFRARILMAIGNQWLIPEGADPTISCVFTIDLTPQGIVSSARLVRSSGNPALDRAAETAIYKASPLPVPGNPTVFAPFRHFTLKMTPQDITHSSLNCLAVKRYDSCHEKAYILRYFSHWGLRHALAGCKPGTSRIIHGTDAGDESGNSNSDNSVQWRRRFRGRRAYH